MQSYTVTSEMAGYGSKRMPKRILSMVACIVAAEVLSVQWSAHFGDKFKLRSFLLRLSMVLLDLC
jgi:hypothetical protein